MMNKNTDALMLETAHSHTLRNRSEIERSQNCACICCKHIFQATEVKNYIDNDSTALCPYCDCDAVLADAAGFKLTPQLLRQLNEYYF